MDAPYNAQPALFDEAADAADFFPPAQSLSADCLSDDIASYFSFDDTLNGSGATTPDYYPPSSQDGDADEAAEAPTRVESKRSLGGGGGQHKPKRKYSASVNDEEDAAEPVEAAVAEAVVAQTKASKRARRLAQIDVAAAVASPSPSSPFCLSPSLSSGSVSPSPSYSSANSSHISSPSPPPHGSTPSAPMSGEVDVGALLAESALKRSRLARKAELARLGRKRKNETIDKYSAQVEKLQAEVRQWKAQVDKERKAHKRALKAAIEASSKRGSGSDGDEVAVKVEPTQAVEAVVAVRQPTEEVVAASQTALAALAAFCKQRGVDSATTSAACSALLAHMQSMAASHGGVDGYRVALQRAAVTADSVAALVARFFASYSLRRDGSVAESERAELASVWQAVWQQPRAQVTEQQVDELNAWMKTLTE